MKSLSNKIKTSVLIFSAASLLYATGCATQNKSYNPNSPEIYTPSTKEPYKPGPGTSCFVNALTFMFHLGGL